MTSHLHVYVPTENASISNASQSGVFRERMRVDGALGLSTHNPFRLCLFIFIIFDSNVCNFVFLDAYHSGT